MSDNLANKIQYHRRQLAGTRYAEFAAKESIEVHITDAREAARQLALYLDWLLRLAGRREAQIEAGTWPSKVKSSS